ncbi:VpsF family polysaccharide biosynthesis protein [Afipia sp. P52-10]|uniref:VpsF family polysaccharide biosynthesis protein n=1 Tax=Afipia sp. P52-10 TaxID=1429916 RepID=UPI0004BCC940|nr:VpsF family polysaccharide biosynthesis protein [Afipia sp. P52-10]
MRSASRLPSPGTGTHAVSPQGQWQRRRTVRPEATLLELGIAGCTALAILATLTISSALLTHWKIQYVTAGGNFYEKLHPATYFTVLALGLILLRSGNPVRELVQIFAGSVTILFYLICWVLLLVQTVLLQRPFTTVVDTFLLPLLLTIVIWRTNPSIRRLLVWLVHGLILLNVLIGYYEFFAGSRIIPLTLGNILVVGEWRSAALLGHPLTASGLIAGYVLALLLKPSLCPQPMLRLALIAFCLGSLMVFGGRTALVTTLIVFALSAAFTLLRMLRGERFPLAGLIFAIAVIFASLAAIFALLDLGLFDKMLLRFSSDKGSALARVATLNLLSHFDWNEIIFGPSVARANALQSQMGLDYGIENFWVSSIVQFGLILTALMTTALVAFFTKIYLVSDRAVIAQMVLIAVIAASSVSFSSKNIQLAQFIILITTLLPRQARQPRRAMQPQHSIDRRMPIRQTAAGSAS